MSLSQSLGPIFVYVYAMHLSLEDLPGSAGFHFNPHTLSQTKRQCTFMNLVHWWTLIILGGVVLVKQKKIPVAPLSIISIPDDPPEIVYNLKG